MTSRPFRPHRRNPAVDLCWFVCLVCVTLVGAWGCARRTEPQTIPTPVAYVSPTTGVEGQVTTPVEKQATSPAEAECDPPPAGWVRRVVQSGDTLSELALEAGVSEQDVIRANCLDLEDLLAGQAIYLPPLPTPPSCPTPPAGWSPYEVQAGDTLWDLAQAVGPDPERVKQANCLDSDDLKVGQTLYLPPLPTPTSTTCVPVPPAGWVRYVVRPGDALFALAVPRGTSVDEVVRVNCLREKQLAVGQSLYLPALPAVYTPPPRSTQQGVTKPTPVPTKPSTTSSPTPDEVKEIRLTYEVEMSVFNVWDSPTPNEGTFVPCVPQQGETPGDKPWISSRIGDLEIGQVARFYACQFEKPEDLEAWVEGPAGREDLEVLAPDDLLVSDIDLGKAQRVVLWPLLCDQDTGSHTLFMHDGVGEPEAFKLTLHAPILQRIFVLPRRAPLGKSVDVFYCGYVLEDEDKEASIDLYYAARLRDDGLFDYEHKESWTWTIRPDVKGTAHHRLVLSDGFLPGAYRLVDRAGDLEGVGTMWFVEPE